MADGGARDWAGIAIEKLDALNPPGASGFRPVRGEFASYWKQGRTAREVRANAGHCWFVRETNRLLGYITLLTDCHEWHVTKCRSSLSLCLLTANSLPCFFQFGVQKEAKVCECLLRRFIKLVKRTIIRSCAVQRICLENFFAAANHAGLIGNWKPKESPPILVV